MGETKAKREKKIEKGGDAVAKSNGNSGSSGNIFLWLLVPVALALGAALFQLQEQLKSIQEESQRQVAALESELSLTKEQLNRYTHLSAREGNPEFIDRERREWLENYPEQIADDTPADMLVNWEAFLDETTPKSWQKDHKHHNERDEDFLRSDINCHDAANVIIPSDDLALENFDKSDAAKRATKSLIECGFIVLDNFYNRTFLENIRERYYEFKNTTEAKKYFQYPCQGEGRIEHLLPYRQPFNDTALYADPRLRSIIRMFLRADFKLELMTVIESPVGSGDQRWHQGWRYLFHEEERLPPYSVVVTIPLDDVTQEMGPTQFCPGKKLRLYHGWRCPDEQIIQVGSSLGTVSIFDYKLLHRGPANKGERSRPMISMVFTNRFFVNSNAFVNRGISFVQTLNQRRYWEQWFWHPNSDSYFVV